MKLRVAAVQAEPVWLNLEGCVEKTIKLIQEAGEKKVQVLGFPEVWIPGYPWPIWTKSAVTNTELIHTYMANSLSLDSPEMERIKSACKEANIFVVLGFSERAGASLYITQAFISEEGELLHFRRKIKPTHVERALWGDGHAESLKVVVESKFGKIGGLNCWEHLQPLLRYYEYTQEVEIHVASWPPMFPPPDPAEKWPFHETDEGSIIATQGLAIEGATFVLLSTQVVTEAGSEVLKLKGGPAVLNIPGGGFAMIFGPDGARLTEPIPSGEEGMLTANIDLSAIDYAKSLIDVVGHYARPDLLGLLVCQKKAENVTYM